MIRMKRPVFVFMVCCLAVIFLGSALADATSIRILDTFPSEPVGTMDVYFQAMDANNSFVTVEKEKLSFRVDNSIILDRVLNVTTAEGVSYLFVVDLSGCYYQASNEYVATALSGMVNGMRSQDNAYFVTMTNKTVESAGYMNGDQAREFVSNLKFNMKQKQPAADVQAPLWDGINMAGTQASQVNDAAKPIKAVLIFTDGVDNEKGKTIEQVLSVFGNCRGTPVYAFVAVGEQESGDTSRTTTRAAKSREGLNRLKNQNGGNYFAVSSVSLGEQYASQTTREIQSILCATVDITPLSGSGDLEYPMDLIYDGSDRKVSVSASVRVNRAAVPSPTPEPNTRNPEVQFTWEELGQQPADLNTIQTALFNGGYLAERSGEVDTATKQALFDFCTENSCRNTNEGISREAWTLIISGTAKAKPTPEPEAQATRDPEVVFSLDDGFETSRQTITQIQDELKKLYYLSETDYRSEYANVGPATMAAMNAFCADNDLSDPRGFTRKAFELLTSGEAAPARTPEPESVTEETPTPVPTLRPGMVLELNAAGNNQGTVIQVQNQLELLGYLSENYEKGVYDATTHQAVLKFCKKNELEESNDGLTEEVYALLTSDQAKPWQEEAATPTPQPTAHPFDPGMEDPTIAEYQNRLNELGYYEGRTFTPGLFDEATQAAQDRLCEVNHIEKQQGASVELQQTVLGSGVKPNEKRPLLERVRIGLTGETQIASLAVPTWVVAAVIGVLTLVAVGVIILLIKSSRKAQPQEENPSFSPGMASRLPEDQVLPGSMEQTVDMSTGDDSSLNMTVVGESQNITLRIDYNGTSTDKAYELSEGIPLIIGRGTDADIRTNKDDMRISRKHGQFSYRNGAVYYRDLSRTGTLIDGQMVHEDEVEIRSGATMHISQHIIKIQM